MEDTPLVSVVVEGYNETLDIGCLDDTLTALQAQTVPSRRVELILVGSAAQVAAWQKEAASLPFRAVRFVSASGAHYYDMKNMGARMASAPVVAFTDSDVAPGPDWLAAVLRGLEHGGDAVAGLTLYRGSAPAVVREAAASISWGFVLPVASGDDAAGFLSHNLGVRSELFRERGYRSDLGRTCAGSFLFSEWRASGVSVKFQPGQRVEHAFDLRWWLTRLHVRFGHEVHRLRRIHDSQAHRWVRHLSVLEPVATFAWHVALDVPQWWRFGRLLGHGPAARLARLPLVLGLSVLARGAEAAGMVYSTFAPRSAARFAAGN
jgi:glycosyltransferase involved in cell wall biosynthesis